mmetsp:Transcript_17866/g.36084  ORF Transcript_17866/g.36084 Transcript_17866/m.36084 type:complete len:432 (+) Transcript_17866:202-1497(+)
MAFDGPLNILLLCTPIALINYWAAGPDAVSFIFSLLALAPMAERLGFVTEQLAMHTNETIGGLLNATFGNATELIVAISALSRGLYRLVQLSLLGSILSNILLVLGCSFFFGGLYQKDQRFGTISSQMNSTLLMIATMGIVLPTILTNTSQESKLGELGYSRGTSLALFLLYFAFIYFQLFSHKHLYDDSSENNPGVRVTNTAYSILGHDSAHPESGAEHDHDHDHVHATSGARDVEAPPARQDSRIIGAPEKKAGEEENNDDDDDEEEDVLGMRNAIIWLGIITVLVALVSDAISATIENAAEGLGMSKVFIAAILLPIVGNAAEHAGAVMFAMKGKLDLSLGVAIGSSTQIALCVLPFMVLLGWMGGYDLSLDFGGFEAATLALSVISVTFAIKDGRSDWLLGLTLCVAYFVIALGFWAHSNDDLDTEP